MKNLLIMLSLWLATAPVAFAQQITLDPKITSYVRITKVGGTLNSIGSDTLNNLMTLWSEEFRKIYPNVRLQIEGKGSSTAPPALTAGTAQLGPMSRAMKNSELEQFEQKYGYPPTKIGVALDALAVFVHKDNPIQNLSLAQVDAIFSNTRKKGLDDISTWGQAGLTSAWSNKPIRLYGRNSASGTYGYFKSVALAKGDYKKTVKEQPGSSSVVLGVAQDKYGIGYSGMGYLTSGVKAVALSKKDNQEFAKLSYQTVLNQKYPLSRLLYVYILKKPNQTPDKLTLEFIKFIMSKQGQQTVIKDGYLPLPANLVEQQLGVLR